MHALAPNWARNVGTELYDHGADPAENTNVAHAPEHSALVQKLSAMLHAGWRAASPAVEQ